MGAVRLAIKAPPYLPTETPMTLRLNSRQLGATLSALLLGLSLAVSPALAKTAHHPAGTTLQGQHAKSGKSGKAKTAKSAKAHHGHAAKAHKVGKSGKKTKGHKLAKHKTQGPHRSARTSATLR